MASGINESDIYEHVCNELNQRLRDSLECRSNEDVVYNLRYKQDLSTKVNEFDTDLCIYEGDRPRVIIEVKQNSASTHDVIVYDNKAHRHKRVYPSLRYGMLLLNTAGLTKKYLWHSRDLDFFYFSDHNMQTADDLLSNEMDEFYNLLDQNISTADKIDRILSDKEKPKSYNRSPQFD